MRLTFVGAVLIVAAVVAGILILHALNEKENPASAPNSDRSQPDGLSPWRTST